MADGGDDGCALLNEISVKSVIDKDGDAALYVTFTPGIQVTTALGMLEYAKVQMLRVYQQEQEAD
jgi:hypothetical protein